MWTSANTTYYVKLQQAYASESNAIGGFKLIGYETPGANGVTTNFTYTGAVGDTETTTEETEDAWKAEANVALNDCAKTSTWDIKAMIAATTGVVSFEATLGDEDNCLTLTPNFKLIGK